MLKYGSGTSLTKNKKKKIFIVYRLFIVFNDFIFDIICFPLATKKAR
jgi:hypothetical protein